MDANKEKYYYFTFGWGRKNQGHYVKIYGTAKSAKEEMINRFGKEWSFQYTEEEWLRILNDPRRAFPMETELEEA